MGNLFGFIAHPMGIFLNFIYNTVAFHSYGLAIIIFTVFIKILLLPLTVKQYRSTSKMQEIQPKIKEIQTRYKNDKEKLNQELMRVYKENKVNPAGGCLPLLVQMPILFSLYWVISQPLKYMLQKSEEVIEKLYNIVPAEQITSRFGWKDIPILNYFNENPELLSKAEGMLINNELIDLNFLGIFNLGFVPTIDYNAMTQDPRYFALLLIPVLAALTTWLSVKMTSPQTAQSNNAQGMGNTMTKIMPFITAFFAFSVPAGLGLYWIISNVVQIVQQTYMNKYVINKKEAVSK